MWEGKGVLGRGQSCNTGILETTEQSEEQSTDRDWVHCPTTWGDRLNSGEGGDHLLEWDQCHSGPGSKPEGHEAFNGTCSSCMEHGGQVRARRLVQKLLWSPGDLS